MKHLTLLALLLGATLTHAADLPTLQRHRDQLVQLVNTGKAREGIEAAESLRTLLTQSPAPAPDWVGFFHLYRFLAYYKAKRFQEAAAIHLAEEPYPYTLPPANQAYMASIRAEIALHQGEAPEEILKWGTQAVEGRLAAGDPVNAAKVGANAWVMLALRDREDLAMPLARKMIELGRQEKKADWILEGYHRLVLGTRRGGVTEALPEFRTQLEASLEGFHLPPSLVIRKADLEAEFAPEGAPPSNRARLEQALQNP